MRSETASNGLCALLLLASCSAIASESVTGTFQAIQACKAYTSFKKGTNPESATLSPGTRYDAVEVNKPEWDWVRVNVPEVTEPLRWVPKDCGAADISFDTTPPESGPQCNISKRYDSYVLAISWQPGFCEHYSYSGDKPECDAMRTEKLVINHLTLHGLWPNREACGTHYGGCAGPKLDLDQSTIAALAPWMPNFYYEQALGVHEWDKHGTCQNLADDDYFLRARKLVEMVDASDIGSYVEHRIGRRMSVQGFFDDIKSKLGQDVSDRVMLVCTDDQYLQEIRMNLPLSFTTDGDIQGLVSGANQAESQTQGCSGDNIYVERSGPD